MSETSGKRKRRSRKSKEEKALEKLAKEQNESNESEENNQENEKKKELIMVFKKYISKNYLKRFSKINDLSFNNEKKEKISSEFFLVRSNLITKQEKISIEIGRAHV